MHYLAEVELGRLMDFRHKNTVDFFGYWLSLPKEDWVPLRSSFHPEEIPALLANTMIYELVPPNGMKQRLLGSKLDNFEEEAPFKNAEIFWTIGSKPCGLWLLEEQCLKSGLIVVVETLCLPLLGDKEGNAQLIVQKNVLEDPEFQISMATSSLDGKKVLQRNFIDIGAGISGLEGQDLLAR